jgi:neutral ceramidase
VVEVEFMGYADLGQIGTGLRQRLYSRSFIIGDPNNPADRFVYMVLDTQSGDTAIRYGILDGLKALGSDYSVYGQSNVAVVGTHSHSGPAAWLNYLLPQITSKGFDKQSYQAIVDGGILSVQRAHQSLTAGTLSYAETTVPNATIAINRSPSAYLANPQSERSQYQDNVDNFMSMLRFQRADGKDMGVLTWLPVHGTSMLGNNTLASGDNKGYAMNEFEKSVQGLSNVAPGFVAGFSQSNVGDTTPRVLGAWCEDGSNVQCSFEQSLCSGVAENCYGRGPNFTVKDNGATDTVTIGGRQYQAARSLWDNWTGKSTPLTGPVRSFHTFQNMSYFSFTLPNGTIAQTCPAALGYSFAAGTSDWPGSFDFKQGDSGQPDDPLWDVVRDVLHAPSAQQEACQAPKPILLDVGETHQPYDWTPDIADVQVMRVGQMFMIISPGEATTMSGRRWKNAISTAASTAQMTSGSPIVVLGGPANSYTHYLATPEEYGVQRYEGASTLFGKDTLNAYINLTVSYLPYLGSSPPSKPLDPGPSPPNNVNNSLSFITGVVYDNAPIGKHFGDVVTDAPTTASAGQTVNVTFIGANPRNDLRLESTYAAVQQQQSNGSYTNYRDDSDWELIFNWVRTNSVTGTSNVILEWIIPSGTPSGLYRMQYFGASKQPITGTISQFSGTSGTFKVG